MNERSRQDRRQWKNTSFPLRDNHGHIVRGERRMQADRRLGRIEAEWQEFMQENGQSLFRG